MSGHSGESHQYSMSLVADHLNKSAARHNSWMLPVIHRRIELLNEFICIGSLFVLLLSSSVSNCFFLVSSLMFSFLFYWVPSCDTVEARGDHKCHFPSAKEGWMSHKNNEWRTLEIKLNSHPEHCVLHRLLNIQLIISNSHYWTKYYGHT